MLGIFLLLELLLAKAEKLYLCLSKTVHKTSGNILIVITVLTESVWVNTYVTLRPVLAVLYIRFQTQHADWSSSHN